MKSNKLKNTIFVKGQKLYNELMFNNILRKITLIMYLF